MATIATLAINLIGNVSGLKSALGEAQQSIKATAESLKSVGTKMTAAVSLPILGVAGAALKGAAEMEQLEVAFTTMLRSGDKAKALMADLTAFSAETPFELPEVVSAGKMLLAYGVAADDVKGTLRQLGDIAAGVGAPIGDIAYLFGTARVQGRLFAADINQFTNRGIPIISALAKTMGVAEGSIKKMTEEGKIGFPELQKALDYLTNSGGQFEGLMAAQSQTLAGLFSTLKDNIGITLATIGRSIVEAFDLRTKLGSALETLGRVKDFIVNLAQTNPALLKTAVIIAAVAAAIGPLLVGLGAVVGAVGNLVPVVGALTSAFAFLLSPLGLAIAGLAALFYFDVGGIRTKFVELGQSIWEFGQRVVAITPALATDLKDAIEWIWAGDAANIDWWNDITDGLVQMGLIGQETGDSLAESLYYAGTAAGDFKDAIEWIWTGQAANIDWWNDITDSLVQMGLIGQETGDALAESLYYAGTAAGDFKDAIEWIWTGQAANIDWWNDITDSLVQMGIIGQETGDILAESLYYAGVAAGNFKDAVTQAWSDMPGALSAAWATMSGTLTQMWTWLQINIPLALATVQTWSTSAWSTVSGAVTQAWSTVGPTLTQLWTWLQVNIPLALATVQQWFTTAWAAAPGALSAAWATMSGTLTQMWTWLQINIPLALATVQTWSGTAWATMSTAVTQAWATIQSVLEQLRAGFEAVVTFLAPSLTRLQSSFTTMAAKFGEMGPLFADLQESIGSVISALMPLIQSFGVSIGAALGVVAVFAVNTLSAVFEALPGVVEAVVSQVTAILDLIATTVQSVTQIVTGVLTGDFASAWEGVKTLIGGVNTYVQTTLGNLGATVLVAFTLVRSVLVTTFTDLATSLGLDGLLAQLNGFKESVVTTVNTVKTTVSGAWLSIKESIALTVETFAWSDFVDALVWPIATIDAFAWSTFVNALVWPVGTINAFAWSTFVKALKWPLAISSFSWSSFIDKLQWPQIPSIPQNWWQYFNPFGGGEDSADNGVSSSGSIGPNGASTNALGTQYWRGGATWVGDGGKPELVVLPRGSQVIPERFAGAGAGGPAVVVDKIIVNNEADAYLWAYEVDDLRRRRRR